MSASEAIGIDLGGTKMLLGVLDGDSEVAFERREPSTGISEEQLVDMIVDQVAAARADHGGVGAIGMGVPATIDQRRGVAISAVNLPIKDLPLRDVVSERTGLPAFLDNDANVAALAEHRFGAARGADNAVMLTIGTGIGGGLILGGELYRGSNGAGVELGHVSIEMDGIACQGNCPNRGCVETYASGTALGREGRAAAEREPDSALGRLLAAGKEVSGREVTVAAQDGDETALAVFDLVGRRLGVALASFANIFGPEVIVVGGGAMAAGDLLLDPARAELAARALPPMNRTQVRAAELGEDSGMIGAAVLARIESERAGG